MRTSWWRASAVLVGALVLMVMGCARSPVGTVDDAGVEPDSGRSAYDDCITLAVRSCDRCPTGPAALTGADCFPIRVTDCCTEYGCAEDSAGISDMESAVSDVCEDQNP